MSLDFEREALRSHAMEYLLGAGWIADEDPPRGGVAMRHVCDERTLALRFDPVEGFVRLKLVFRGADAPGWLFRGGAIELRVYVDGPAMLGLLCRITSAQAELWPDGAVEWIEDIVSVFPEMYVVIAKVDGEDLLVQVAKSGSDTRALH